MDRSDPRPAPQKRPGAAAVAVLILALGFGALAAALAAAKGALLDELPYRDPGRLVALEGVFDKDGEVQDWGISHIDSLDWRRDNRVFEQMAVWSPGPLALNLMAGQEAERLDGELVSHEYFSVLGIEPSLGRFFTAEEDGEPFVHPVVILSHDLWQRRFDGEAGIVGRGIALNGAEYRVVGVAPPGFRGLTDEADAWIPSSMPPGPDYVRIRRMRWLAGVARLEPGVTVEEAQADLDRITAALAAQYPEQNKGMGVRVRPLDERWFGELRPGLRRLVIGAALVLLLACLDAAVLLRLRARAAAPSPASAVGQGLLLSLLGAALGLALAAWAVRALVPASGITFPGFVSPAVGPWVVAVVLALAAVAGLAIGLAALPAARAGRTALPAVPGAARRLASLGGGVAVALQIALAVALSVWALLAARDYRQAAAQDLGFRPEGILTVRVDLKGPKYSTDEAAIELARLYLERLSEVPGVERLAIAGPTIPSDPWAGGYITVEDHDSEAADGMYTIMTHGVSPGYFELLGVPMAQGRAFTKDDTGAPGTPFNVIVSKEMAEQQWPGKDPVGQRLKFGPRQDPMNRPWLTVVGVAGDIRHEGPVAEPRPAPDLYLPVLHSPIRLPMRFNVLARPADGVSMADLGAALEREIRALTPDVPPYDTATLEERLERQTAPARFEALLVALFGLLALVLAVAGVYGFLAGRASYRAASLAVPGLRAGEAGAS